MIFLAVDRMVRYQSIMTLIHNRTQSVLLASFICFYFLACNAFRSNSKSKKYEVILKDIYNCKEAHPPYIEIPNIIPNYTINVVHGKRFLSGSSTIVKPTPFRNFSARTFFINKGRRELKMHIASVSCKNIFARTIIVFSQISFSQKDCMLKQGTYEYTNMDLDKILHALPNWHAPGRLVHQLQLVSDGATEFCEEVAIEVK